MFSSDKAHRLLKLLGWSTGSVGFRDLETRRRVWLVVCRRDEHTISCQGWTELEAYSAACRFAGQIERAQ
jgi:hypothetical protein